MMVFGVCFVLYLIKLSAGKGFYTSLNFAKTSTVKMTMRIKQDNIQN